MEIIFIGGLFPPERREEIYNNSKNIIQNAADNLQWAIINGLSNLCKNIKIVSIPYINSYLFGYSEIKFKSSIFKFNDVLSYCVGFNNLPLIKMISKYYNSKNILKEIAKSYGDWIIIYSIHTPFLLSAISCKKKYPKIKLCLVVPDLPEYMSESKNILYRLLKKIDSLLIGRLIKNIDSFVLLSSYMSEKLNIGNKPWIRMEGIYEKDELTIETKKERLKTILYTGNINSRYGIKDMINAFKLIENKRYRLWIRGDGNTKKYILDEIKKDNRIVYFGNMNRKEIKELQRRATILINPVKPDKIFTRYFFPSKTMEYYASGTPCIMYKLDGVPEEYYNYCIVPEDLSVEKLRDVIVETCEKDSKELNLIGEKAAKFIESNKNPIFQTKKIFNLLRYSEIN